MVKIEFEPIAQALNGAPGHSMMLDIDLTNEAFLPVTKNWLGRRPKGSRLICVVDRASRLQYARACGLGATDILKRPVHSREVLEALWGNLASLNRKVNESETSNRRLLPPPPMLLKRCFRLLVMENQLIRAKLIWRRTPEFIYRKPRPRNLDRRCSKTSQRYISTLSSRHRASGRIWSRDRRLAPGPPAAVTCRNAPRRRKSTHPFVDLGKTGDPRPRRILRHEKAHRAWPRRLANNSRIATRNARHGGSSP